MPEKVIREILARSLCSPFRSPACLRRQHTSNVSIPLVPAFDTNMEFSRLKDRLADNLLRLSGRFRSHDCSRSPVHIGYVTQTTSDLIHLRWRKVFSPSAESELPEKHGGEGIEPNSGESRVVTGVALLGIMLVIPAAIEESFFLGP